ncbi:MAG TPA: transposase [Thermodesulfobacteriota bacterium]|nr:transposase [Thermodesulfobacteriota bacterium]
MEFRNAKEDIQFILSFFSEAFSRPSFKIFSSFVISFIQAGKEAHTSSMVQSLTYPFLRRSLSSFTRFLGQNIWAMEEIAEIALFQFFHHLRINTHSVLFLIVDDTITQKTGTKMPGCAWHKEGAYKSHVFGHQWVLFSLLYQDFLLPLWAHLYHSKGTKGCGPFRTKILLVKKMLQALRLPVPCKVYLLADGWYWGKPLAQFCRTRGYHMISQLRSNSVLFFDEKRTKVTTLSTLRSAYREVSVSFYGKPQTLRIARFVGLIKNFGKVAVVVVKEKRKKPRYLVSTNLHLSALDILRYYAKRWKIEQMIKDLKQRLGFGHYQVRNLQAIQRHVAIVLLSYCGLIFLKILQWLRDKKASLHLSIRLLAFHVRRRILIEHITVTMKNMRIQFKQNILDSYLERLWA